MSKNLWNKKKKTRENSQKTVAFKFDKALFGRLSLATTVTITVN